MRDLQDKKQEYRDLKTENDLERIEIKKERAHAEATKFRPMKKKHYFLPALHEKNIFITTNTHHVGDPYVDDRENSSEMMPDRAFKKDIP